MNHNWVPSTLGHGTTMCSNCKMTDREAAALGELNECRAEKNNRLAVGDRIRLQDYYGGLTDYTVEEFRQCLGVFLSDAHREAGDFTPVCLMYGPGPESEEGYISNYGAYTKNMVPMWMNIPRTEKG